MCPSAVGTAYAVPSGTREADEMFPSVKTLGLDLLSPAGTGATVNLRSLFPQHLGQQLRLHVAAADDRDRLLRLGKLLLVK